MLWHLEDSNLHLMASIHALKSDRHGLFPEAEQIYQNAERVTFETDLAATPDQTFIVNAPEKPLSIQIPPALFASIAREWDRLGLAAEQLEQLQPWRVAMTIGICGAKERGISAAHGVDQVLWGRSETDDKLRTTLEEPRDALIPFSTLPDHEKVNFLEYAVNPPTTLPNDFDIMIQAWHEHDDQAFERILRHRLRVCPVGFENICAGRNRAWLPKIVQLALDQTPTLVLVGALHCVGEAGLPKLLEKQGVRVSRVI